jgi:hypothetical protein
LASIITIIIGIGLLVQAFNAGAEASREINAGGTAVATSARGVELSGEVMINVATGLTGINLGILGLVAVNTPHLVPAALIVFGGALILSGAVAAQGSTTMTTMGSWHAGASHPSRLGRVLGARAPGRVCRDYSRHSVADP